MTPSTWSLGRRITALGAIVAALLGFIAIVAAATANTNRDEQTQVMDRLTPSVVNAERLFTRLLRQQASLRAFALSGRDADLALYQEATAQQDEIVQETRSLLAREPTLLADLDRTATAIAAYRREVADPLIAAVRRDGPSVALAATNDVAMPDFERAAAQIQGFGARAAQRRAVLADDVRRTSRQLVLLLVSAAVIVFLASIALVLLLRRVVTTPVVQIAEQVRRVAGGEYDVEITGGGSPELTGLAQDVNTMRRRIAADLADVRAARIQVEQANEMLSQQAEELTRSNRDLEQFAYVASHDLQEPLRKVASFCQLLQRRYAGQLDDRADQYIHFAVDGAQRMQRLINDLLAFSRIGRLTSGFGAVNLNDVVVSAAGQFDALRSETDAEITFEDLPTVQGEEPLLTALFANLIGNALKFRHPERAPRVHITVRQLDSEYEIACADNGIGIAPEFADKVFVIFQRLHTKEAYPGTGIGLAIAKKIIEYHGGRIWVDPEHTGGTLFRFTLPVPAAEPSRSDADALMAGR